MSMMKVCRMSEILAMVESPKLATFRHFCKDVECQLVQWRFDRYLRKSEVMICLEVHRRRDNPAMAARAIAKERVLLFHRLTSEAMETASLCRGPIAHSHHSRREMTRPAHGHRDKQPQHRECAGENEHAHSAISLIEPAAGHAAHKDAEEL